RRRAHGDLDAITLDSEELVEEDQDDEDGAPTRMITSELRALKSKRPKDRGASSRPPPSAAPSPSEEKTAPARRIVAARPPPAARSGSQHELDRRGPARAPQPLAPSPPPVAAKPIPSPSVDPAPSDALRRFALVATATAILALAVFAVVLLLR